MGGAAWKYADWQIAKRTEEASRLNVRAATHADLNNILLNVISKSNEYAQLRDSINWQKNAAVRTRLVQLHRQVDLLKESFQTIETGLATLEERSPRPIDLELIPSPPPVFEIRREGRKADTIRIRKGESVEIEGHLGPGHEGPK